MEYISNYEVRTSHSREKNWIDMSKLTRKYIAPEKGINEELGSFISTIIATILRESFR